MVKHTRTIRQQQRANCLSVFDHFVGLALKGFKFECNTDFQLTTKSSGSFQFESTTDFLLFGMFWPNKEKLPPKICLFSSNPSFFHRLYPQLEHTKGSASLLGRLF